MSATPTLEKSSGLKPGNYESLERSYAAAVRPYTLKLAVLAVSALSLYLAAAPLAVLSGNLLSRFYKPAAAIAVFDAVLACKPGDCAALEGLADCYRAQGNYAAALAFLSQILRKHPELANVRAKRAELYEIVGLGQLAKPDLQILRSTPAQALRYQRLSFMAVYAQDEPSEIIRLASFALSIDPTLAKSYANRAQGYIRLGQYKKAVDDATAGLALSPSLPSTRAALYARRAQAYYGMDQVDLAIADGRAAIDANPSVKDYINLALFCKETGRFAQAIDTIREGIRKVDRIDMVLNYMKRQIYLETGDVRVGYTRPYKGFPIQKLTEFFLDKTDLYLEAKNLPHALQSCLQAEELSPTKFTVVLARGRVYLAMGMYDRALKDFNTAVTMRPKLACNYYFRSLAKRALGESAAADADLNQAKQLGFVDSGKYIHILQDYMP